jgi:acetylornithine deacetylase/succinyl-diaminopimelate desuccinylase-like protein
VIEVTSETLAALVLSRTVEIAAIPAPTGGEGARAGLVAGWWREDGWTDVDVDAAGNVWALARRGDGGAVVLAAHLDTVFADDVAHVLHEQDGRLLGPGVGDDSVAVAALSAAGTLLARTPGRPVWLLATVGEEGLGNLCGIVSALDGFGGPVEAVLAVEGNYLGRVSAVGVGSVRWRARLSGPGGHAWEAAGAPSAVHAAAGMIRDVATLAVAGARTVVNVGRIAGGEAINARARECWFELDIRADDPAALADLEARARTIMEANVPGGVELEREELGRRPAGSLDPAHPLVRAAAGALEEAGLEPSFVATSTDANAAHARGIPAVAVGVTTGGGEHTPQEWIDVAPIALGLSVLAATITRFEEAAR